ncbi:hypothetical protein KEJ48_02800 [Candidatus Bathyarchaeota archaeon]|nr:hypothetical protein [Candidatus Bathyarchaeota archaeon]
MPAIVEKEQEEIYNRVKDALGKAEKIANDETLDEKYRLEALRIIGFLGQVFTGVLKVVKLDEIQKQLLELEKEVRSSKRRETRGGYWVRSPE